MWIQVMLVQFPSFLNLVNFKVLRLFNLKYVLSDNQVRVVRQLNVFTLGHLVTDLLRENFIFGIRRVSKFNSLELSFVSFLKEQDVYIQHQVIYLSAVGDQVSATRFYKCVTLTVIRG